MLHKQFLVRTAVVENALHNVEHFLPVVEAHGEPVDVDCDVDDGHSGEDVHLIR